MNAAETMQAVLQAIETSDFVRARSMLTDDFTFGGAVPQPLGPDAWLGVHQALGAAMPDFSFNARGFREEGGTVTLQVQITGTQTRELVLPVPGIAPIPPTGKHVSLPTEDCTVTLRGDKLLSYMVGAAPGGGLPGILAQLGASLPAHA